MDSQLTMYGALKVAASQNPRDLALYYEGKKLSFKTLMTKIDEMADILYHRLEIRKNDVVMIAQPNIPETIILFYALNKIGAVANLIHPFTPFNQVKAVIKKTKTKYAFMFEQRIAKEVERYREIANQIFVTRVEDHLPCVKKFIYHHFMNFRIRKKLGKMPPRFKFDGFNYLADLKPLKKEVPEAEADKNHYSVLLHSGSTTGKPKTICLSDFNFNYLASHTDVYMALDKEALRGHAMLSILPSFHGFGLCMTMHAPLVNGFSVVLIPKFSAKGVVETMKKVKITCVCGVPVIYEKLIQEPSFGKSKGLKDLRCCFCGGDSMPFGLEKRFNDLMAEKGSKCRLFQGYGLTEAIAVNTVNTFNAYKEGSIGKAIPGATIKIVDENRQEVKRGEIGEILIKSDAVMLGYYLDKEATDNCLVDGFLYTGDLGYMDEDGFVFFKARKKRVIKVSGYGVFPSEIEQLIESMPEVSACAAISIPDPVLQNAIKVLVVAKYFDEQGMKEKILQTCHKYLIRWSVPKEIEFRKQLPLTLLNKIDFKVLQEEDKKRGLV
ncbi:MAG: acyl--CoA ligase [Erysipelotrichia bacterium]|nr:acyl--CoA ligase [Erysipelotrichia bacterium]